MRSTNLRSGCGSLAYTSASAESFLEESRIFLFSASSAATMFAMVCVLPVPGGPLMMSDSPFTTRRIISSCTLSCGSTRSGSSAHSAAGSGVLSVNTRRTSGCAYSFSRLRRRS